MIFTLVGINHYLLKYVRYKGEADCLKDVYREICSIVKKYRNYEFTLYTNDDKEVDISKQIRIAELAEKEIQRLHNATVRREKAKLIKQRRESRCSQ